MALLNPGFEDEGASIGLAEHWTLTTLTALQGIAGFGPSPHRAQEDFDRWTDLQDGFGDGDLAIGLFDVLAESLEDFSDGWGTDVYLNELPDAVITAPFGGGAVEDCEAGWSNDAYAWVWGSVAALTGQFDGEAHEDFEESWRSNESYLWLWSSVVADTALFDGAAQDVEDFENDWTAATTI